MMRIFYMLIAALLVGLAHQVVAQPKPTKEPSMPEYPPANLVQPTSTPLLPTPTAPTPTAETIVTQNGVAQGALLLAETFDAADAWENYTDERGVRMQVDSGIYRAFIPRTLAQSYVWTLKEELYGDTIINVETLPARVGSVGAYGILCRADTGFQGHGYYFIVFADGSAQIGKSSSDKVVALSDAVYSAAIKPGLAGNTLRAVCVGDYLAFYINDTLIAEARDSEFASGYPGITALSDGTSDTEVLYDNLTIHAASIADSSLILQPTVAPVPRVQFSVGPALVRETFDNLDAWENYTDSANNVNLRVENGVYHATAGGGSYYIWGLNSQLHTDVIIDVEATQQSDFLQNGYGVMCRADTSNDGDGYYFFIGGDGYYAVRVVKDQVLTQLVDWKFSDVIRQGRATNKIRAVCLRDYLALYVNDVFLADAYDSSFTSGYAGLSVATTEEGGIDIIFDNLTIYIALPR